MVMKKTKARGGKMKMADSQDAWRYSGQKDAWRRCYEDGI